MPKQPAKKRRRSPSRSISCDGEEAHQRLGDGQPHVAHLLGSIVSSVEHRVGAREPRGDERARGVGEPDRALERPRREQPVHQRAAERVAGAEAAHDVDRHAAAPPTSSPRVRASTPAWPRLTIASSTPSSSRWPTPRSGSRVRDRDRHLVAVADRDRGVLERRARPVPGLRRVGPERRAMVEVVDVMRAPARLERGQRRGPARHGGEPGAGASRTRAPSRIASRSSSSAVDRDVRRRRLAVDEAPGEALRRVEISQNTTGVRSVGCEPTLRSSTPNVAQRAPHVRARARVAVR